ncbi:MAG: hypothetical protein COC09_03670 [Gammaproteobacteria bacterium]|nr:hypothetical protein [Gammaproteobacteria bacterium]PCH64184.1 MAG: hypothetical protein COC09_03670 [Gammaproteobacteria bacterium]
MTQVSSQLIIIVASWIVYFYIHSFTASTRLKHVNAKQIGLSTVHYRLLYVILSTVLLLPIVYLIWQDSTPMLWQHEGAVKVILDAIALLAVIGFIVVARSYNMISFLGLSAEDSKHRFSVSWLHRFVRHPWYFFGLLIIWTRDMSALWLVSCICITVYLIVGSRLEDNKLVAEFGDVYRYYQNKIPGLIMMPGRYLSAADRQEIERLNTNSD